MYVDPVQVEIPLDTIAAAGELGRALRSYIAAVSRPRRRQCWSFIAAWLWCARRDAVIDGAIRRNTAAYDLVCRWHADAQRRLDACREAEARGARNATA